MTQNYIDPARESEPYALPDIETFHMSYAQFISAEDGSWMKEALDSIRSEGFSNLQAASDLKGWYWWACFPGCLPDSDPFGPFASEDAALADARDH